MGYGQVNDSNGDAMTMEDHLDHLLVVEVLSLETNITTKYGPADAIKANVLDVNTGQVYRETLLWGKFLVSTLQRSIGEKLLGVLVLGEAKPGQSAPYKLQDASGEAKAVKKAEAAEVEFEFSKPSYGAPATADAPF